MLRPSMCAAFRVPYRTCSGTPRCSSG